MLPVKITVLALFIFVGMADKFGETSDLSNKKTKLKVSSPLLSKMKTVKKKSKVTVDPSKTYIKSVETSHIKEESYHEPTESYITVEEYSDGQGALEHIFVSKVNDKLVKKIEEKKWIFDSIFDVWLQILEIKKKLLYKLWKKKQGKKKESGENNHYEYYIPYYTSTYKPYIKDHSHYRMVTTVSYPKYTTTSTYATGLGKIYHYDDKPIFENSEQPKYKMNHDKDELQLHQFKLKIDNSQKTEPQVIKTENG